MKIDVTRPYVAEVAELLTERSVQAIERAAVAKYGTFHVLTIGQWSDCMNGDFSCVLGEVTGTWLQVYWLKAFRRDSDEFVETLAKLSPKMDADEKRAADDLLSSTLIESVLVFTRSYFGLPSFRAAEDITLGEVLMAKKAAYNDVTFRKRLAHIQTNKYKR